MKIRHTLYLLLLFVVSHVSSQRLVSATFLTSYDKTYFSIEYGLFVDNGVELYRLLYLTESINGAVDTASGLLVVPDHNRFKFTTTIYHHGTVGSRFDVPGYESFESIVPAILGAYGFVALAPDYLGLGYSKGFHPYLHAESQAWSSVHMMEAAKEYCESNGYYLDDRILLTGYSQGGHASMATHRYYEGNTTIFTVPAAVHMSGPYDLSGGMKDLLLSDEDYPLVAYAPFVALGMDAAYGLFDDDLEAYFMPEYVPMVDSFRNEQMDLWTLNEKLVDKLRKDHGKALPKKMFHSQLIEDILSNEEHPMNIALRANDVYDWSPQAYTRLFYCQADEQVSYLNALTARDVMQANGASDVQAININPNGSHTTCFQPSLLNALTVLLRYRSMSTEVEDLNNSFVVYPNPSQGSFDVVLPDDNMPYNLVMYDMMGKLIHTQTIQGMGHIICDHLPRGIYSLRLHGQNNTVYHAKLSLVE